MRADRAEDVGGGYHYRETHHRETRGADGRYREQQVLEGDYEIRDAKPGDGQHDETGRA